MYRVADDLIMEVWVTADNAPLLLPPTREDR